MRKAIKTYPLYLALGASSVAVLVTGLALQVFLPGWRWHHEPLHSTLEALGGLAAMAMAIVLLQRTDAQARRKLYPLAGGFLGMGLLEVFHAMTTPGNGFVLLRSMASLVGGIGFGFVWLRAPERPGSTPKWMPWVIAGGALAFGIWTLATPEQLPALIRQDEFTPTAIAPKSLACMLFLAAAVRFLLDYHRTRSSEDFLFACLALMFGLAELMFTYSTIWDGPWWFWHWLRLMAYLLVLGYVGQGYLKTVSDLQNSLLQTKQAEETVRQSEQRLRQVIEERERLAQDLHDGAIQSIFTLGLSLERCQRLIPRDPKGAVRQISDVIADLKLVIRDLRSYIGGAEPEPENGPPLGEAMASLVRTMNHSAPFPFHIQEVDQAATTLLSPAEATDVLYVLKEAMSNSLRHSRAKSGSVSLLVHNGTVRLEVEDDGFGFDTADVPDPGYGLRNMAARARRLGGRLEVLSERGKGTRVIFEIHKKGGGHVSASA